MSSLKIAVVGVGLFLWCGADASAVEIEDMGPYAVGSVDVSFEDTNFDRGTIVGRVFYPAQEAGWGTEPNTADGPYPLVGFQHGWLCSPSDYDELCSHLASWGFLVVSTGTETGFFASGSRLALDTRSFLHWAEDESGDPSSWLSGLAADGPWGASGHSMGGGALGNLIGAEPRVRTIIGLQSAGASSGGDDNMRNYTGNGFQIAGSVDAICRPATVRTWFEYADIARRNTYYEVQGMGHTGCFDSPPNNEPLDGEEQHRLHRRLVTGIFRAEMKGEENLYFDILGQGLADEPVEREMENRNPPFWVQAVDGDPGCFDVGIGGRPGFAGIGGMSPNSGETESRYGVVGLDLDEVQVVFNERMGSVGWTGGRACVDPDWGAGDLFFQGLVSSDGRGAVSRVEEISAVD